MTGVAAPKGGSPAFVVAASNAPLALRNRADLVCDGTGDQVEINQLLTSFPGAKVVLTGGDFTISAPITIPIWAMFEGAGLDTAIHLANSANVDMITWLNSSVRYATLRNFLLDGNSANQTSGRGIWMDTVGGTFTGGIDQDHHNHFEAIYIHHTKGDGFSNQCDAAQPNRANKLFGVQVYRSGGVGFNLHISDSHLEGCDAGNNGSEGFLFGPTPGGANNMVVGCKSFGSGAVTSGLGFGWHVKSGRVKFLGCEAQDSKQEGFFFKAADLTVSNCLSTRNGQAGTDVPGFHLSKDATQMTMTGCLAEPDSTNSAPGHMNYGYMVDALADYVSIKGCQSYGHTVAPVLNSSSGTNIEIEMLGVTTPPSKITPGANGTFLQVSGGVAVWGSGGGGGGGGGGGSISTGLGNPVDDFSVVGSSASGPATTPGCKGRRFVMPVAGTLAELYVFLTTAGGNLQACIVDTGDASAGNRTVLWVGSLIATSGMTLNAWNSLGTPALSRAAGANVDLLLGSDNASVRWGAAPNTVLAGMAALPSGVDTASGGAPMKLIVQTTSSIGAGLFPSLGGTIAESALSAGDRKPLIAARVV